MCEFSEKLVAWLDHEIDDGEAARLKQHLQNCLDCRKSLAVYTDLDARLADYCDAVFAGASKPQPAWLSIAGRAVGAVAAAALLVLLIPRDATNRITSQPPPSVQAPVIARQTSPVPVQTIRRRRMHRVIRTQSAKWQPRQRISRSPFRPKRSFRRARFLKDFSLSRTSASPRTDRPKASESYRSNLEGDSL